MPGGTGMPSGMPGGMPDMSNMAKEDDNTEPTIDEID